MSYRALARSHARLPRVPAIIGTLLLFFSLTLTACGGSSSNSAGHQDCGTLHGMGTSPVTDSSAGSNENCFWQAFLHCQSATLVYVQMNVDTTNTQTFSLRPSKEGCSVLDTLSAVAASGGHTTTTNYACISLQQQNGGLVANGCSTVGTITIPGPKK